MGHKTTNLLLAGVVALGVTVTAGAPASAAETKVTCNQSTGGITTCAGVQTTSGAIRGYARIRSDSSSSWVSATRVTLQRRVCGGGWVSWTTNTGPENGRSEDSLGTTYVDRPSRVQFRTVAGYIVTSRASGAAYGITRTSRIFGSC